jgi:hypothetical protein
LHKFQAVGAEMTLQVQHALASDRRQFGRLDGMQPSLPGA